MLLQTFEIALNGVTNIRHCFVTSFPLRDAAGQSWAFGDKHAVFIRLNCDAKFHVASLAIPGAVRNARKPLCIQKYLRIPCAQNDVDLIKRAAKVATTKGTFAWLILLHRILRDETRKSVD